MRVLIIDQCSGEKDIPDDCARLDESTIDEQGLESLLEMDDLVSRRARNLYDGRQQRLITEAVDQLAAAGIHVDRYFVSAGFGFVAEDQELPAYDVRFQNKGHAKQRGHELGLPTDVTHQIETKEYDIVFLPLGATYYEAVDVENAVKQVPKGTFVVVFNRNQLASNLPNVVSLTANSETGSKYGGGAIGVKGTYLKNFAANVAAGRTIAETADIEEYCTTPPTEQAGFEQFDES